MSKVDAQDFESSADVPVINSEFENVASGVPRESGQVTGTRERTLTDKGREYQLDLKLEFRKSSYQRLTRKMDYANSSLRNLSRIELEQLRDNLDKLKEEFNESHRAYERFWKRKPKSCYSTSGLTCAIENLWNAA